MWSNIRSIVATVCGIAIWALFIFGPIAMLASGFPLIAITCAATSLCCFSLSFRWRSGSFVLVTGCLGLMLVLYNTATISIAFAMLAKNAGFDPIFQIALGLCGIPFVIILLR